MGLTCLPGYYWGSLPDFWRWDPTVKSHSLARVAGQVFNSDAELWPEGDEGKLHLGIVGVGWAWGLGHCSTFSCWSKDMWYFGGPLGSGWLREKLLKSDGLKLTPALPFPAFMTLTDCLMSAMIYTCITATSQSCFEDEIIQCTWITKCLAFKMGSLTIATNINTLLLLSYWGRETGRKA